MKRDRSRDEEVLFKYEKAEASSDNRTSEVAVMSRPLSIRDEAAYFSYDFRDYIAHSSVTELNNI